MALDRSHYFSSQTIPQSQCLSRNERRKENVTRQMTSKLEREGTGHREHLTSPFAL